MDLNFFMKNRIISILKPLADSLKLLILLGFFKPYNFTPANKKRSSIYVDDLLLCLYSCGITSFKRVVSPIIILEDYRVQTVMKVYARYTEKRTKKYSAVECGEEGIQ